MFIVIPNQLETLYQERPWANHLLVAISTLISFAFFANPEAFEMLILNEWNPIGLLGHTFLHGDFFHLLGNMIFLWVFGNAICSNIGNGKYLGLYFSLSIVAAIFHNLFDGGLAIGASGAINGVIGLALAMYPINRIHCFYLIFLKGGSFRMKAWQLIGIWFLFDLWGAMSGSEGIAYWAHIGGLLGGTAIGLLALHQEWLELTEYDNESLLEALTKKQ